MRAPAAIGGRPRAIHIGSGVYFGPRATLAVAAPTETAGRIYEPQLTIGSGCWFGEQLFISCNGRITIGRDVLGSARVSIVDNNHDYQDPALPPRHQPHTIPRPVTIGDGVFLGVGCVILPGVTLGERSYVGANALVTKDVPAWTIVGGNPARPLKEWNGDEWVALTNPRGQN